MERQFGNYPEKGFEEVGSQASFGRRFDSPNRTSGQPTGNAPQLQDSVNQEQSREAHSCRIDLLSTEATGVVTRPHDQS
jgi:hypothetical protein